MSHPDHRHDDLLVEYNLALATITQLERERKAAEAEAEAWKRAYQSLEGGKLDFLGRGFREGYREGAEWMRGQTIECCRAHRTVEGIAQAVEVDILTVTVVVPEAKFL